MSENSKTYKLAVNAEGLWDFAEDGEEMTAQEALWLSLADSARTEIVRAESEHAPKCKHPRLDKNLRCKSCGAKVDIQEKRNKYGNRRTDGFQSAHEAKRYGVLKSQNRAGIISDLECQVPYDLDVNGVHITRYVADFRYKMDIWPIVEDAKPRKKGFEKTAAYRMFVIKKRLMKAIHGVDVVEV